MREILCTTVHKIHTNTGHKRCVKIKRKKKLESEMSRKQKQLTFVKRQIYGA